jgi:hypothetical protein
MIWLIGSSVVILASALATAALYSSGHFEQRSWWVPGVAVLALPVFGFGLAVTLVGGSRSRQVSSAGDVAAMSPIAWPGSNEMPVAPAALIPNGQSLTADGQQVAPVSSLIDGLKARLEKSPADAQGWALLATSYAFVGQQAGADEAIGKAVALGLNEAALRERVAAASRSPQAASTNWTDAAPGR